MKPDGRKLAEYVVPPAIPSLGFTITIIATESVPVGHAFSVGSHGVTEMCIDKDCKNPACILRKVMES